MIFLARHGQAAWGTRDYDRLTETGTRQAQLLGRSFAAQGLAPTRLITGGMRRHEQTAAALAKEAGWSSEWEADPRFAELDHLDVIHAHRPAYRNDTLMRADLARTLRPRSAFWKMFDVALTRWRSGEHDEDYAQTYAEFVTRIDAALADLAKSLGRRETAVVVTSAGVMSTVAANVLDRGNAALWSAFFAVTANTGCHLIEAPTGGLRLVSANVHTHLIPDGLVTVR
jgi:broad specificity phosphatase PhoE